MNNPAMVLSKFRTGQRVKFTNAAAERNKIPASFVGQALVTIIASRHAAGQPWEYRVAALPFGTKANTWFAEDELIAGQPTLSAVRECFSTYEARLEKVKINDTTPAAFAKGCLAAKAALIEALTEIGLAQHIDLVGE